MTRAATRAALLERGVLTPLDDQLARALGRLCPEASDDVLLAAALVSRAQRGGHVCLDLATAQLVDGSEAPVLDLTLPAREAWLAEIAASPLVTRRFDGPPHPLALDDAGRLYLWRQAQYQARLARALTARAGDPVPWEPERLKPVIERLFGVSTEPDVQRLATLVAARHRLAVISGGPGTGKTTTVARLLALLQEQAIERDGRPLRVALVAPTGKAAQRLGEAIDGSLSKLDLREEVRASITGTATTIHRALGYQPATPTRFRHGAGHPLSIDLLLADEASMIDLALMTKLVEAVPSSARLILLGDRDQLASVEAGAILGDIFDPARHAGYSPAFARDVERICGVSPPVRAEGEAGLDDCLVQLTKSYRYTENSGIGALARAVNAGDADRAVAVLEGEQGMPYGEVARAEVNENALFEGALGTAVLDGYRPLFTTRDPGERLERLGAFRVLCAHRRGPLGVETVNLRIEQRLREAELIAGEGELYDGRPILITRNDHQLELFNGDVGVILREEGRAPRAWFTNSDRGLRSFHPSRLPPHETVYAMTVHKSQGSEFGRIAVLLPARRSPVLTRELLYTAVSRARDRVDVHGSEAVLREAIGRRVERASGLAAALRRPAGVAEAEGASKPTRFAQDRFAQDRFAQDRFAQDRFAQDPDPT